MTKKRITKKGKQWMDDCRDEAAKELASWYWDQIGVDQFHIEKHIERRLFVLEHDMGEVARELEEFYPEVDGSSYLRALAIFDTMQHAVWSYGITGGDEYLTELRPDGLDLTKPPAPSAKHSICGRYFDSGMHEITKMSARTHVMAIDSALSHSVRTSLDELLLRLVLDGDMELKDVYEKVCDLYRELTVLPDATVRFVVATKIELIINRLLDDHDRHADDCACDDCRGAAAQAFLDEHGGGGR